ncbi:cation:proton antiporter [Aetokthonos hydrillicola Thurmond2011]|jgi:Kef-type K+ transport system membrane component KefB|uniref:Cation:proton antiporter n=1 Tax=Aetokthonos hydrillicola Thurmond2011 TaxID=2712845 RepID=A0AAP5ICU0_9CYAN|nr:cation:proton antiporter [Aetokthonos hydrillicola]MBO3463427.1 universal stress protein [Aetokthonos hydrillicola CCALA 1050]MBW4585697.1 cation:proton antiporter [Aetokthonos hydrillicola CCALA 1050]MDR9899201.1 cation:proton antiporter [Aetokthonos hydrillicola Thurmond2011]
MNLLLNPILVAGAVVEKGLIKPLGHKPLLLVLLELALLLLVARTLGELMRRVKLPPVIGELLAGVLLGPSVFGWILPNVQGYIFPHSQSQSDLVSVVSWLGVLFLLIVTGLETDLNLIVRKGKTALLISLGGIIVPFVTGLGLGWFLPENFLVNPDQRLIFSLFIATAMSISAVPVIAKVLMDLKLIRRDIGQVTLAAGMTDDTIGWILLSVVSGLASSGKFDFQTLFKSVGGAVLFLVFAFTIGRSLMATVLRWVDDYIGGATASLSAVLVLALSAAAFTHNLGIEAALGAFVTGILAGQSPRFSREAGLTLELITAGFLAPIFFATAGLKVDLLKMLAPETLKIGLLVLAIACFGKFTGAYIGSRIGGLSHWEGIAMGSGMNARGAMEIIVATIGVSLGVLNPQMYSIVVMVAIVTSLMAPPLLRWSLSHVSIGEEEAQRLEEEQQASRSFIKRIRRVLMPTQGGPNITLAAQLISHLAYQNPLEVTVLFARSDKKPKQKSANAVATAVKDSAAESAITAVEQEFRLPEDTLLQTKVASGNNKAEVILKEACKGYDLIVIGATESHRVRGALFSLLVDRVVQEAPCPTMVVKSNLSQTQNEIIDPTGYHKIGHILVPTSGNEYNEHAVEVASAIAAQTGAVITIVNVIHRTQQEYILFEEQTRHSVMEIAQQIVHQHADIAQGLGAIVKTEILTGIPEYEILKFARTRQVDLIVLGSSVRTVSGRAFFGHRTDAILNKAVCPVAVITLSGNPNYC